MTRRAWSAAWTPIAALAVLSVLAGLVLVGWTPLIDFDDAVSRELVRSGTDAEVDLLRVITLGGDVRFRMVLVIPLAAWLLLRGHWQLGIFAAAGISLVGPLNRLIKWAIDRPRPTFDGVERIAGTSYPSGHSSGAAALAAVVLVLAWSRLARLGRLTGMIIAAAFVGAVGVSRIMLGVHYPSDVVAGWALGVGWVVAVALLLRTWPPPAGGGRSVTEEGATA